MVGSNEASGLFPCRCYFASMLSHRWHLNSVRCKRQYLGETSLIEHMWAESPCSVAGSGGLSGGRREGKSGPVLMTGLYYLEGRACFAKPRMVRERKPLVLRLQLR